MMATSPAGQLVHDEPPTMRAWPRIVPGPRTPTSLEDGGRPSAEQLGHREVDAGRGGRVVLRAGPDREHLEEARVEELGCPGVFDERAIEGRRVDMGVRRDEARG